LEKLIQSKDGEIPGTHFQELYKMDPAYKEYVKSFGGPKAFVKQYPERFAWGDNGTPGGSVTLVKRLGESARETNKLPWDTGADTSSDKKPIDDAWVAWQPTTKSGYANNQASSENQQSNWRDNQRYDGASGHDTGWGVQKGDSSVDAGAGWRNGDNDWESRSQANANLLAKMITWHGGTLLASNVFKEIKDWRPKEAETFKAEVQAAGGVKKFISRFPDRFQWTLEGGPGTEAVCLMKVSAARNKSLADVLVDLIHWHGAPLLASKVVKELNAWKPNDYEAIKAELDEVGGMKKFVAMNTDRFNWVLGDGPGMETIHLIDSQCPRNPVVEALVELLQWNGGSMLAAKLCQELKTWKPKEFDQFKVDCEEAGGMKKYVGMHHNRCEWALDSGPGTDSIRLTKPGGNSELAKWLTESVTEQNSNALDEDNATHEDNCNQTCSDPYVAEERPDHAFIYQ